MDQLNESVAMISGGEPIPPGFEDAIKIALIGSSDMSPTGNGDWQSKFAQGLTLITDTTPGKGIIMYRGMRFLCLNCKSWGSANQEMTFDNPDFVKKLNSDLDYCNSADCIFFNFLKGSQAPLPLLEFSSLVQSQKMVVRCPNAYVNYGYVRIMCERFNVPLLPGATTSILTVLQTMQASVPKFLEVAKLRLPE